MDTETYTFRHAEADGCGDTPEHREAMLVDTEYDADIQRRLSVYVG